jgi:hypothetical protein
MLVRCVAVLAFAAQALALEAAPYKPMLHKMALPQFGLSRRQLPDGYVPEQTVCGEGTTCAQACGDGYTTCASGDSAIHCFNPAAKETCCPNGSGSTLPVKIVSTHGEANANVVK